MKTRISFTKKDLFVVLGCVVFLLGNLAVTSSNGRARAKEMVCKLNLQKWGAVFGMYTADNNGFFQEGWTLGCKPGDRWFDLLMPYFDDNNDIRCCPTATKVRQLYNEPTGASGKFSAWGKFMGPAYYPTSLRGSYGSYGINIYVCNPTAMTGRDPALFWRTPNVSGADQIPVLFDCAWIDVSAKVTDEPPQFDGDFSSAGHIDKVCIDRHNAAVNILFMDFSVRKVGLKQLWNFNWHREWSEDLAQVGLPTEWNNPNHWMYNMKDYPPD